LLLSVFLPLYIGAADKSAPTRTQSLAYARFSIRRRVVFCRSDFSRQATLEEAISDSLHSQVTGLDGITPDHRTILG